MAKMETQLKQKEEQWSDKKNQLSQQLRIEVEKNSNLEAEIENLKKTNEIIIQEKKEMEHRLLNTLKQKQVELNHEKKIHCGIIAKNEILEKQIEAFER